MATTTSTPTSAPDPAEAPFQLEIRYKLIAKRETIKSWREKTVSKCENHKSNHGIIFNEASVIFWFLRIYIALLSQQGHDMQQTHIPPLAAAINYQEQRK